MYKKITNILLHVLVWTVFLATTTLMSLHPDNTFSLVKNLPILISNLLLVCFFYLNANFLFVKFIPNKKYLLYVVIIGIILLLYIYFHHYIFSLFMQLDFFPRPDIPPKRLPPFEDHPFMMEKRRIIPIRRIMLPLTQFLLFWTLSLCYRLINEWMSLNKRNEEIEAEKTIIELAYLKAQINPHFIINTLNAIYSLILKKSDKASDAILLYSQLIRYIFDKIETNFVPLQEEIDYINNYIELQVLRYTDTLQIEFEVEGNIEDHKIAPLTFISFIENSFQYGISNHYPSTIAIHIKADENNIHFTTKNKKYNKNAVQYKSKNIGIKNTKRKLNLIYPDKHKLSIRETNDSFFLELVIFDTLSKGA